MRAVGQFTGGVLSPLRCKGGGGCGLSVVALPQVSLDKARTKSEAVVGQEDVPMRSKLKEVEKIYARARAAAGQGGKVTRCSMLTPATVHRPLHTCRVVTWYSCTLYRCLF